MTVSGSAHEDDCYCWGDGGDRPTINKAIQLSPPRDPPRDVPPVRVGVLEADVLPHGQAQYVLRGGQGEAEAPRVVRHLLALHQLRVWVLVGVGFCVGGCEGGGLFIYIYVHVHRHPDKLIPPYLGGGGKRRIHPRHLSSIP